VAKRSGDTAFKARGVERLWNANTPPSAVNASLCRRTTNLPAKRQRVLVQFLWTNGFTFGSLGEPFQNDL